MKGKLIQWTSEGVHNGTILDKLLKDGNTVYLVQRDDGQLVILAPEMIHIINP
jgi:hypothetical protein